MYTVTRSALIYFLDSQTEDTNIAIINE